MQGAVASGYVGQTVKISVGRTVLISRVAYIDAPASRGVGHLAKGVRSGVRVKNPSYWPGSVYGRLRPELFPSRGPLSRAHYLRDQSVSDKAEQAEEVNSGVKNSAELENSRVEEGNEEDGSKSITEAQTGGNEAEYYVHKRGELLDLREHRDYHDARMRNSTLILQTPSLGSMPVVRRNVIESSGPVVAPDHDMKLMSGNMRLAVAYPDSGFLKPQQRATQNRVTRASHAFLRETCAAQRRIQGYIDYNEALDTVMETSFGKERVSTFDLFCLQSILKEHNDDSQVLMPPLSLHDVQYFESKLDGTREAMESRWIRFFEAASSQTLSPLRGPVFKCWDDSRREFLQRLSLNLIMSRKDEIHAIAEALKPVLSEARKANPQNRFKRPRVRPASPSSFSTTPVIPIQPTLTGKSEAEPPKNETWPFAFHPSSSLPKHFHELFKNELSRSLLIGLALFASSSTSHPISPSIANILSNTLLGPLGYTTNPVGAHLMLIHLGLPLSDPAEIPYLLNLVHEEDSLSSVRPYPFMSPSSTLEDMAKIIENTSTENASTEIPPALDSISPRHVELSSLSSLPTSSCEAASNVLRDAVKCDKGLLSEQAKTYLTTLANAGSNPNFRFSKHVSSTSNAASLVQDSSQLLNYTDLDAEGRKDLSDLPSFAIDDKSTTEVDDAFALDLDELLPYAEQILRGDLEKMGDDGVSSTTTYTGPKTARVFIHIADPTTVMRVGDDLEMTARERVETVYLPHRKSFMLPSVLSEFYCSLQAHPFKNIALTFEAHVDLRTGELVKHDVFPSKFNSMKRVSYEQVQTVLRPERSTIEKSTKFHELIGKAKSSLLSSILDPIDSAASEGLSLSPKEEVSLKLLGKLAELRKKWRVNVGNAETMSLFKSDISVNVSASEPVFTLSSPVINAQSRSLVEEMMVMVGEITGRTARDNNIPVPFRTQEHRSSFIIPPFDPSLYTPHASTNMELFKDPRTAPALSYDSVLDCEVSRMRFVSDCQALAYMSQSSTTSIAQPHRSLGLSHYSRASSPLRRYADIISHLQLKAWKRYGGDKSRLPYSASLVHSLSQHINSISRDIKYTQQHAERWWKNQYVLRNCLEGSSNPENHFKAIVYAPATNLDITTGFTKVASTRAAMYSFFILGLDLMIQMPAPSHLEVGQVVSMKPIALSELHLDWVVIP